MTEPNSEPEIREFYDSRPKFVTHPSQDMPGTVRIRPEDWDRRTSSDIRRVIKTDDASPTGLWMVFAGSFEIGRGYFNDNLVDWVVIADIDTAVAYKRTATRDGLEAAHRSVQAGLVGDMGEEAFRG
jgi:hypothetical protein